MAITTKDVVGTKINSVWNFFGRGQDEPSILTVLSVRKRSNGKYGFRCVNQYGTGMTIVLTEDEYNEKKQQEIPAKTTISAPKTSAIST